MDIFHGKRILVTGGTGTIGQAIVRELLGSQPAVVRILSRDETGQFFLAQELAGYPNVRFLIGDVRDRQRLFLAMDSIDIVFHAAALKHVPSSEYNPFEAVCTNVLGTQNVIDVSLEREVERVVVISTDKAANPTNVVGATKLLAERLAAAAMLYRGNRRTRVSSVRFGNVLNSRGSLAELVRWQIKQRKPVTITDPNMTRFLMGVPQAVELICGTARLMQGGEVFILKMPAVRIGDLIPVLVEEYARVEGISPRDVPVETTRPRTGERMHELLMTESEGQFAQENDKMFIIPPVTGLDTLYSYEGARAAQIHSYTSADAPRLSVEEIRAMIIEDLTRAPVGRS
jgi:FlaA1/EpsC-like NDP-sugar epimerase